MKLFAISDLHVGHAENRAALQSVKDHPKDWLILGGDLGESLEHLRIVFDALGPRFRQLMWVPGNHELYVDPLDAHDPRGEARYAAMVAFCRSVGVLTPEDAFPIWTGEGGEHLIAPLFLLYDYSFRPTAIAAADAVAWAEASGVMATDEVLLDPHPYPSRQAWCAARLASTAARLASAPPLPTVLINHFPMRQDLVYLPFIPRYSIWCGTTQTHDWHRRFRARVVVTGHLHTPRTDWIDGVRFEEVSFGYPRQRRGAFDMERAMREILPGPTPPAEVPC